MCLSQLPRCNILKLYKSVYKGQLVLKTYTGVKNYTFNQYQILLRLLL